MKPLIVSKERFLKEVKEHKSLASNKRVNWRATDEGIEFFLSSTHGTEWYYYKHSEEITPVIEELITEEGQFFGFYEEQKKQEVRFGQINPYGGFK